MNPTHPISVHIAADGIAHIKLHTLTATAESVIPATLRDLVSALQTHAARTDVTGIVVHATGPAWLPASSAQSWLELCGANSAVQIASWLQQRNDLLRTVERLARPVAIVLEGDCTDLCLEFALACHHRIAVVSEHPRSTPRFGLPLIQRGIPPSAGATQRLTRIAGIPAALPLLLSGTSWDAETALRHGVLQLAQDPDAALALASEWVLAHPAAQAPWDVKGFRIPQGAGAMAAHATRSFTDTVASVRKATNDTQPAPLNTLSAIYEGTQLPMDSALHVEVQCAAQTLADPATANQIRTLWLERTQAEQLARRPPGIPVQPVQKLGILGGGLMGAGIAQVAATAGLDVVLIDTTRERTDAARAKIIATLTKTKGTGAEAIAARILATDDLQRLQGCDFIIEAVFEDRSVKAELMHRVAQVLGALPAHFVWASNTSTLPISGLADLWASPAQVIGMHFFSPVPRMPLLEIIRGAHTSEATLARTMDLAARLGKTPILVNDSPGFYTSRIFCAYIDEGMAMLAEGISPALIENAARQAGFATSPLAVTDEVSLDLQALVIQQARHDGLAEKFLRLRAQPVVARMNELGRLGRKSGGGFYDYRPDGTKQLWPGLSAEFPLLARQPSVDQVQARLLCIQALESARCLEEQVLTSPADGDLGSILGLGFPAWTGGTLSYVDTVGARRFVERCDALANAHGERFRASSGLRDRADRHIAFSAETQVGIAPMPFGNAAPPCPRN